MGAALDRSNRDRIGDEKRLQTRLDDKQATNLAKHRHGYPNAMEMALFRPFPIKDNGKLSFNASWLNRKLSRVERLLEPVPKRTS
jgi:hypothetical protein